MCGIWFFLSLNPLNVIDKQLLFKLFNKIKNRGPDQSTFNEIKLFENKIKP